MAGSATLRKKDDAGEEKKATAPLSPFWLFLFDFRLILLFLFFFFFSRLHRKRARGRARAPTVESLLGHRAIIYLRTDHRPRGSVRRAARAADTVAASVATAANARRMKRGTRSPKALT